MRRFLPLLALPAALLAGCTATGTTSAGPAQPSSTASASTGIGPASTTPASTTSATTKPTTPVQPVTSTGTPRCHSGDLKVTRAYGDGATGHYSVNLRFTNKSSHTCTLSGYPGVSWVAGDAGKQVNDPFKREGGTKKTITVKPGATAHSMLLEVQHAFIEDKTCKPTDVRGYRIYPPDETASIFVSAPEKVCSAKGVGLGEVYPVTTGAGQSAS
jgi:hypothetical protein